MIYNGNPFYSQRTTVVRCDFETLSDVLISFLTRWRWLANGKVRLCAENEKRRKLNAEISSLKRRKTNFRHFFEILNKRYIHYLSQAFQVFVSISPAFKSLAQKVPCLSENSDFFVRNLGFRTKLAMALFQTNSKQVLVFRQFRLILSESKNWHEKCRVEAGKRCPLRCPRRGHHGGHVKNRFPKLSCGLFHFQHFRPNPRPQHILRQHWGHGYGLQKLQSPPTKRKQ